VTAAVDLRETYLDLVKSSLLATVNGPLWLYRPLDGHRGSFARNLVQQRLLRRGKSVLAWSTRLDPASDPEGRRFATELPPGIMTMIGQERLDDLQFCVSDAIERGVPGDVIETGVWRGGSTILMRAILKAYGDEDRSVYVADSFEGLPPPNPERYPADEGLFFNLHPALAVSLEDVQAGFERYGLLDDRVVFVKGWFRDTLPGLRDHQWSVIRLDGDLYESTMDTLTNLYPGLSPGGWLIVDDYSIDACRAAVTDYRKEHGITGKLHRIDWTGVRWQKPEFRGT
jgi:O-methyltransferase